MRRVSAVSGAAATLSLRRGSTAWSSPTKGSSVTLGRSLITRGVLALALSASLVGLGAAPAQAIPTIPAPSPALLTIVNYYSGSTLVGQKWWGCPGAPGDSWGVQTHYATITSAACG
jgi:hypothetical protein